VFRWGCVILLAILLSGCAGSEEKSELLSLLGVDERSIDTNQDTESTFDAITLLKRGEALYIKKEYIEAAAEFERFLLLHPFHRMAAFSQFRLAMSHFQQRNTIDRDPGPRENAMAAFQKLISQYPQSLYIDEANEKISELKHQQARHEFLIGHFYYKTNAYPAAIARFEKVLAKATNETLLEKTRYFLGLSNFEAGDTEAASEIFKQLLEKHPHSPFKSKIRKIQPHLSLLKTTS